MRYLVPFLLPLLLLGYSFFRAGVYDRYRDLQALKRDSLAAEQRFSEVQAVDVSFRYLKDDYAVLLSQFSEVTGLKMSSEEAVSRGESAGQVARFVEAVTEGLKDESFSSSERAYLEFKSVTPGERQVWEPFFSVDFELNLEGRFFALPDFLKLISVVAQEQQVPISIGELRVSAVSPVSNSGELSIVIPLRAYFLER
ncbi:MAG TPA: hypothetical protein EYO33_10740 [Phycisphaerales bacterium]|nr:hypothetical protein [Phycisphaerales bacterium]